MPRYEYKVVPAPAKGVKAKGVKRAEDRFALALAQVMNAHGAEGWDYVRADILPAQERSGLASKQTVYHNMLVFRRELADAPAEEVPEQIEDAAPLALDTPPVDEVEDPVDTTADTPLAEDPPEVSEDGTDQRTPLAAQ